MVTPDAETSLPLQPLVGDIAGVWGHHSQQSDWVGHSGERRARNEVTPSYCVAHSKGGDTACSREEPRRSRRPA